MERKIVPNQTPPVLLATHGMAIIRFIFFVIHGLTFVATKQALNIPTERGF
jgi:hypothetical protein